MATIVWILLSAFVLYVLCKIFESVFGIDLSWLTGDDSKKPKDDDKSAGQGFDRR